MAENALCHQERFRLFRKMYQAREFRLVLCLDVSNCIEEYAMQTMDDIVSAGGTKGGLDYLHCEPFIICEERIPRPRYGDSSAGGGGEHVVFASAL